VSVYLRAESGQLPELKRVIAAYGDRVVMEETPGAALAAIFKEIAALPAAAPPSGAVWTAPASPVEPAPARRLPTTTVPSSD
jgi:uncharacterized membrane protein (UPF0182 family)